MPMVGWLLKTASTSDGRAMVDMNRILLIGYGNPGRRDDGLGPGLIERLEYDPIPAVVLDADYQLTVEHAWDLSQYPMAIFADAVVSGEGPYFFRPLQPDAPISFSTHSVSPGAVLHMAREMFDATTEVYVLGIRGYEFEEIAEGLTERAQQNLDCAEAFIRKQLAGDRPCDTIRSAVNDA